MSDTKHLLAITACPSGVAHTYMAAEHLAQAAKELGYSMAVETHGSIGIEGTFTDEQIRRADAVVIAADKNVPMERFAGKRVVYASAIDGIHKPAELIERALSAPQLAGDAGAALAGGTGREKKSVYQMLMNGVSHMIPFVVVGGLLIALAYGIGGVAGPEGLVIPEGSYWNTVASVGGLAFGLMVPILSGYIAMAIADRPGLAPGMITGMIAITPALYNSDAGTGFLGGIVTGFLSGFVALGIKKIKVHKYIQTIWPIIVIPVVTTVVVAGLFIFLIGGPVATFFAWLTAALAGLSGTSAVLLGLILGAMISFDMGGPVNKVAFLFAGGLIATGNFYPMGMVAVAIAVPPLGMALATFIARKRFTPVEREAGIAAAFMGFFGITEGAIPFAAARPLQIIPANVIGGAVGGALAGLLAVEGHVMWGGLIDVVVGGIGKPGMFILALAVGSATTAAIALALMHIGDRRKQAAADREEGSSELGDVPPTGTGVAAPAAAGHGSGGTATAVATLEAPAAAPETSVLDYISDETILMDIDATDRDEIITQLVLTGVDTGQVADAAVVRASALAREEIGSTAVGNGIAIPHAKSSGVAKPMLAFARNCDGVEWASPSGDLAQLIFLIAVPKEAAGDEHLRILAKLSRALVHESTRTALLRAKTKADVRAVLADAID